jgi:hypothetical protein
MLQAKQNTFNEVTGMEQHDVGIPHGEDKIMVELTVKEAIALSGIKFHEQPELLTGAKKKLKQTVDNKVLHH